MWGSLTEVESFFECFLPGAAELLEAPRTFILIILLQTPARPVIRPSTSLSHLRNFQETRALTRLVTLRSLKVPASVLPTRGPSASVCAGGLSLGPLGCAQLGFYDSESEIPELPRVERNILLTPHQPAYLSKPQLSEVSTKPPRLVGAHFDEAFVSLELNFDSNVVAWQKGFGMFWVTLTS